jgi:hypothetical protein
MTEEQSSIEPTAAPGATSVPQNQASAPGPSFGQRALRWIFRMVAVILIGMALGAGSYYGGRKLYRDAIEPLLTLDQRMLELESRMSDLADGVQAAETVRSGEIGDLEADLAARSEELSSLGVRLSELEQGIEALDVQAAGIEELRSEIDRLGQEQASTDDALASLDEYIQAGELPVERVERMLQLMRVMNLMTRARLWIEQENYGLANEDLSSALEIMQALIAADTSDGSDERLEEIANRIESASEFTSTNQALSEDELEAAWKLLFEVTAP